MWSFAHTDFWAIDNIGLGHLVKVYCVVVQDAGEWKLSGGSQKAFAKGQTDCNCVDTTELSAGGGQGAQRIAAR